MLLVDDHQPQARKLDVALQQLVRADGDVDRALGQRLDVLRLLLRRAKARQLGNLDRPFVGNLREAVGKSLEVLLGQEGGRGEHGDLLAAADGDECRAQRDLGLAEADVAADQAVHRFARAHVVDHGADRGRLVHRFLEAETLGERVQIALLDFELIPQSCGAPGIEIEQFGGGVTDLQRRFLLGAIPVAAAELVQRRLLRGDAAVAADQVQLRHRHIELVVPGVLQVQKFGLAFAQVEVGEAQIAADAVLGVDHRVADAQLRQVAHHALDRSRARLCAPAGAHRAGIELGLGDYTNILVDEGKAAK